MPNLKAECRDILSKYLGRELTPNESRDVIPAIRAQMANLRREDRRAWDAMTYDERVMSAAGRVSENMHAHAQALRHRAQLSIVKAAENQQKYRDLADQGLYGKRAVGRILEDAYRNIRGVQQQYFSRIANEIQEAIPTRFFGLFEDRAKALELVKVLRGEGSSDADAVKCGKVISSTLEDQRQRFNRAGGDIGLLEDWGLPQSHDADKIARAANRLSRNRLARFTGDQHREAWINFIWKKLDRSRYVDPETGELADDIQLRRMLEDVYRTLVTDGNGDQFGSRVAGAHMSSRANHGSQHRSLHFKDAESYMAYEQMFGTGSVMTTIMGRVRSMGKDIALLESLGPNPTRTYRMLSEIADSDLARARGTDPSWKRAWKYRDWNGALGVTTDEMWNVLNGNADSPAGMGMFAKFMQGARNLQVAGKLGSAIISSFSDIPTYWIALRINRIPAIWHPFSLLSSFSKQDREFAARAGILADVVTSNLGRWYEDNIGNGLTAVLADATIRLSLLDAWTNAIRRAFALNFMSATGKLIKSKNWAELDQYDRFRMEQHGITESDWRLLRLGVPEEYKGCAMLTRRSVESISEETLTASGFTIGQRDEALSKYLSMIQDESFMASLEPDLATRTSASRGAQRGTLSGEFWRSLMLFKSFPFAMITRHFSRGRAIYNAVSSGTQSRLMGAAAASAYGATVITATTVFGALSLQAANLLAGRDLQDPTQARFWGNAMMKGGGLGVFGDMLYNGVFGENRYGSPNVISFLGPIAGSAFDTWDVAMAMLDRSLYDKDTKWEQKALRLVRGNTPFMNVWYAKMALDHAVFNDLNEMLSPGYLRRQRQKSMRSYGQGYWWRQDRMLPDRRPRFANAPRD